MLTVTDNPEAKRYEGRAGDDVVGVVEYRLESDVLTILHTEVAEDFLGEGVGSALLAGTLDDVRARGLKVRVVCPFARAWLRRHTEYADLASRR